MSTIETEMFKKALDYGFQIVPCSCSCGGQYAWLTPDYVMFGCVCHTNILRFSEWIEENIFIKKEEVEI